MMTRAGIGRACAVVLVVPLLSFCGSSPSAPGEAQATITITADGISPKETRIKAWNHVRFVNNDSRSHTIVSDPVNLHSDCPPLNRIGLLQPGQSRDTGTLHLPGVCGFHDHDDQVDAYRGRIVVE